MSLGTNYLRLSQRYLLWRRPICARSRIDATREVVFSQTKITKTEPQRFFVNGKLFDEDRMDIRVPLGNI